MFKKNFLFGVLLLIPLLMIAALTVDNFCASIMGINDNQQKNSCQIPLTENWQIETWEDT